MRDGLYQSHMENVLCCTVHDHVQLGVQRESGNCDHGEAGGSRQEVRDNTGKLCEIKGTRLQGQCSVFSKYGREIIVLYILNFISQSKR